MACDEGCGGQYDWYNCNKSWTVKFLWDKFITSDGNVKDVVDNSAELEWEELHPSRFILLVVVGLVVLDDIMDEDVVVALVENAVGILIMADCNINPQYEERFQSSTTITVFEF